MLISNAPVPIDQIDQTMRLCARCLGETPRLLADELLLALSPWRRTRGLLARPPLGSGEAMLLRPCRAIHTCFMGFPIDVLFLTARGEIGAIIEQMVPWRFSPYIAGAVAVLELPAGALGPDPPLVGQIVEFAPRGCSR